MIEEIKLTQYSHGGGCGCKIAPQVLDDILKSNVAFTHFDNLLVGNEGRDDAAVYQLNDNQCLIATTDFFTPIVDDPFIFGQVAAANALSDVYAMGGRPVLALAILGWPINKLPVEVAQQVMEGGRSICHEAGVPVAGGHSIDSPEPIFGLAVNGLVEMRYLKQNNGAKEGDFLLLTKPIGVGIYATAVKRKVIEPQDLDSFYQQLIQVNKIGELLGRLDVVHAITDVTGFGLGGHLVEMATGSGLTAELYYNAIPKLDVKKYLTNNVFPDATYRNWNGYGDKIDFAPTVDALEAFQLLPDPQTNGGLLVAVSPEGLAEVQQLLAENGYHAFQEPIGRFVQGNDKKVMVV